MGEQLECLPPRTKAESPPLAWQNLIHWLQQAGQKEMENPRARPGPTLHFTALYNLPSLFTCIVALLILAVSE